MANENKNNIDILGQMMMVEPRITIMSGRTATNPEELQTSEKPPAGINATMPIVEDSRFADLRKARTETDKGLTQLGIKPTKSAWLICQENWPAALELLKENKELFDAAHERFVAEQDEANAEFPNNFPGWEHVIESGLLSAEEVRHRFGFSWIAYGLTPVSSVDTGDAGLDELVGSFGESLFHEIAVDARKSYKDKPDSPHDLWIEDSNKSECTAKALGPLRRISEKLSNLLLLHPSAVHIRDLVEEVLSKLPSKGPFVGSNFMMIKGVIDILVSEQKMEGYGRQIASNATTSRFFPLRMGRPGQ